VFSLRAGENLAYYILLLDKRLRHINTWRSRGGARFAPSPAGIPLDSSPQERVLCNFAGSSRLHSGRSFPGPSSRARRRSPPRLPPCPPSRTLPPARPILDMHRPRHGHPQPKTEKGTVRLRIEGLSCSVENHCSRATTPLVVTAFRRSLRTVTELVFSRAAAAPFSSSQA
jgi:hypothetical protein